MYPDPLEKINRRERACCFLGFLVMIVLTLGVVFLAWDYLRSPKEAEANDTDTGICKEALMWYLRGNPEVVDYCLDLKDRGL